jgi:pathogenesis-related protein 1
MINRLRPKYSRPPASALLAVALSFNVYSEFPSAAAVEPPQLRNATATVLQGPERDRFIAAHNAARKAVAVDPLTWSDDLAAESLQSLQEQQETLIRAAQDGWSAGRIPLPTHRTDSRYGENIAAWAGNSRPTAEYAVALWLREKPVFDLLNSLGSYHVGDERPSNVAPTSEKSDTAQSHTAQSQPLIVGHYTQVIWPSTLRLGAAQLTFDLADDQVSRHYVALICNYDPPGNQLGEKPY